MRILITGGAGYIGSHTCVELLQAGHEVVAFDNLCNASPVAMERIAQITGKAPTFIQGDVRDKGALAQVFAQQSIDAVIHFAGLKAVGESVAKPLAYYDNNVVGTLRLLEAMGETGVKTLVFSSSATVYGDPREVPVREDAPLFATSPYGRSKLIIEDILRDLYRSDPSWNLALLRYFNPVGAHESGLIGENPNGIPNNLMPYISQVAIGLRPELSVFGNDYPTPDGTGVRDYIHVVDLAKGHSAALQALKPRESGENGQLLTVNLGTGQGHSVLEIIRAFEKATGRPIPYRITPRRPGDVAIYYADPTLAKSLLGWQAELGLEQMCRDAWRWQQNNPQGFAP